MPDSANDNPGGHGGPGPDLDFERIVSENSGRVYNVLFQMMGNAQDAEELSQEVFYQAYKSLHRFEGRSSIATWLHRIAMNVATDALRKKTRRPAAADTDYEDMETMGGIEQDGRSAEYEFLNKESLRRVKQALLNLPVKYRAPFVLNVVEGYSHQEISEILGISYAAARTNLHRAMKMLRNELCVEGGES